MKMRLIGTEAELNKTIDILQSFPLFELEQVSRPYPGRGSSTQFRVYIDCSLPDEAPTPKRARRQQA